ncbi:MAG: hypothetical protein ACI83B_002785 [Sediminicola sp.]|jgi:hypothetical protein|tara:strand:+ start:535 stop:954 length:420 start_codon:yes stop_codon:yes gene_type:complete
MKYIIVFLIAIVGFYSCDSSRAVIKATGNAVTANDTIRIANDSLEYEILIIEPGFNNWILTQPPKGYYGIPFLESRNRNFVIEYNNRVLNPQRYSVILYPQQINYEMGTHYGLEVNYMLYNYFLYFQRRYKQKFIGSRN